MFKSLYTIAQVNTPRLTGCCKKVAGATKCTTHDTTGKPYDITEWNTEGFLNTEANQVAWKVYVDNQIPQLGKLFGGVFVFPEGSPDLHETITVSPGKHTYGGYTLYGEAWRAMTGYYRSASEAASTWIGPSSAENPVCGGTVKGDIWDTFEPKGNGVYVKSKYVNNLASGIEVQIVEVTEYKDSGSGATFGENLLANYTLPVTLLVDFTTDPVGVATKITASYAADKYSLWVAYSNDKQSDVLDGRLYSSLLADTVVLPLGVDVRIDPASWVAPDSADKSKEYTYYELGIADLARQEWVTLAQATAEGGKIIAVDRLGVVRDTQPAEDEESKQVAANIADQPAGLGEYTSSESNDVYRWNLCPAGSKLAAFAQPEAAKWVVEYDNASKEYAYALAFKFTQPSQRTQREGYQETSEANAGTAYEWKATTIPDGVAEDDKQAWKTTLSYQPKTTGAGKQVKFAEIKFKTVSWDTIDNTNPEEQGIGPIKVTLELLPATSGGYGLRALKRVYTQSGHILLKELNDQELIELNVLSTSPAGKLVSIPAMQEITVLNFDSAQPEDEYTTPAHAAQGDSAGWAVAVGKSSKYWPPMVAELRSKPVPGSSSFYLLHSDLEVDDTLNFAGNLMDKVGYLCATAKRTAVAVYNKQRALLEGEDKVYHTPGWYWSVADGKREDARYTGGMKTKTFACARFVDGGSLDRVWVDTTLPWDVARQADKEQWYVISADGQNKAVLKALEAGAAYMYVESGSNTNGKRPRLVRSAASQLGAEPECSFDDYIDWAVGDSDGVFSLIADAKYPGVEILHPLFECNEHNLNISGSTGLIVVSLFKNSEGGILSVRSGKGKIVHPDLYVDTFFDSAVETGYTAGDLTAVGWNSYSTTWTPTTTTSTAKTGTAWWNMVPYRGYYYGQKEKETVLTEIELNSPFLLYSSSTVEVADTFVSAIAVLTHLDTGNVFDPAEARWYEGQNTPTAKAGEAEVSGKVAINSGAEGGSTLPSIGILAGSVIQAIVDIGDGIEYKFNQFVPADDTLSVCLTGITGKAIVSHYDKSGYCEHRWLLTTSRASVLGGTLQFQMPPGIEFSVVVPDLGSASSASGLLPINLKLPEYTWASCVLKVQTGPSLKPAGVVSVEVKSSIPVTSTDDTKNLAVYIGTETEGASFINDALDFVYQGAALAKDDIVGYGTYGYYSDNPSRSLLACTVKLVGSSAEGSHWLTTTHAKGVSQSAEPKTAPAGGGRRPLVNKAKNKPKILGWLY